MRIAADYYRDPTSQYASNILNKHNVGDWDGLASAALALTSNLLPELQQLQP
jgi:hypothetical protein